MRGRGTKWLDTFYTYFEDNKDRNITFDEVIDCMYQKVKRVEASFCSKMLSIINPNMPVLDQ